MEYTLENLVGDKPVSEQIGAVLEHMAPSDHTHDYAARDEVEDLKRKVEMLINLVGDIPVSEQIDTAIKNIK